MLLGKLYKLQDCQCGKYFVIKLGSSILTDVQPTSFTCFHAYMDESTTPLSTKTCYPKFTEIGCHSNHNSFFLTLLSFIIKYRDLTMKKETQGIFLIYVQSTL